MKSFSSITIIALLGVGVQADHYPKWEAKCRDRGDGTERSFFRLWQQASDGEADAGVTLFESANRGIDAWTNLEYRLVDDCADIGAETSYTLGKFQSNGDGKSFVRRSIQEEISIEDGDLDGGVHVALIGQEDGDYDNLITCCQLRIKEPVFPQ